MRRGGLPLKVETVEKIFELTEKGLSSRAIADELNARQGTVLEYLKLGKEKGIEKAKKLNKDTAPLKITPGDIWKDELAKDWLLSYAEGGRDGYIAAITLFCNIANKLPSELIEEAEEQIKAGKLLRERNYFKYFIRFEQHLKEGGYADSTTSGYIFCVKALYQFYQIYDLPKKPYRKTSAVNAIESNNNAKITKKDIQDMLNACRYLRDRAIITSIASSGIGSAELRALAIEDFLKGYDEGTSLTKLSLRRVKTNNDFITFLSPEATEGVGEYLEKERGIKVWSYEKDGEGKEIRKFVREGLKKHKEEPLFAETKRVAIKTREDIGLSRNGLIRIFKDISRRLKRDIVNEDRTQQNLVYNELRAHNLRKYFNTEMKNAGAPEYAVEFFMGHKVDSTRAVYYLRNEKELTDIYLKYMPAVIIQPTETQVLASEEYKELKDALKQRNGEVAKLREEMEAMKAREEAREPYDETMTKVLERLIANPEIKELIKKELGDIKGEKP